MFIDGFTGVRPCPPMSNTERQRRFRERNPGYYGRLHRKRNAEAAARAAQTAPPEAAASVAALPVAMLTPLTRPTPQPQLCLPAPIPTITLQLPLLADHQPEPLSVLRDDERQVCLLAKQQ